MKPEIFTLDQINSVLGDVDLLQAMEEGFIAYSEGKVVVPPVGELLFDAPPGDAHIKYGYIQGADYYVIKIASGFYENVKLGIPAANGLMLLFRQKTGEVAGILMDEGHLTNLRTAAAGAVVAKHLAPKLVTGIGVFGAGIQGRLQLRHLRSQVDCRKVLVWGLNEEECLKYKEDMEKEGFEVDVSLDPKHIARHCNLLVLATPSRQALLKADWIQAGTHITAMGSDTPEKQELDVDILARADEVVCDSLEQCQSRGELFKAVSAGAVDFSKATELGNVIRGTAPGRVSEQQLTVADLTGVAIQDIQISVAVFERLSAG